MIKTFVKHWIYELCIQQFFNAFRRNFSIASKINNVKVGDIFDCIIITPSEEQEIIYYRPKVVSVYDDFFTIKGHAFAEKITENGVVESYIGENYSISIFPADSLVKYINFRHD